MTSIKISMTPEVFNDLDRVTKYADWKERDLAEVFGVEGLRMGRWQAMVLDPLYDALTADNHKRGKRVLLNPEVREPLAAALESLATNRKAFSAMLSEMRESKFESSSARHRYTAEAVRNAKIVNEI